MRMLTTSVWVWVELRLTLSMAVEFSFMIEAWASRSNTVLRAFLVNTF